VSEETRDRDYLPDWRRELDGYIRRHEADHFAHAAMRHDLRNELGADVMAWDRRLTSLERWQQRVIGAGGMLSLLLLSGVLVAVVELLRK
jgi:hypothetical protein